MSCESLSNPLIGSTKQQRDLLAEHLLPVSSIVNMRDVGGFVIGGKLIKRGLLLRGGSLANITDSDRSFLREVYHISQVFDFRTEMEVRQAPDRDLAGAEYMWLPAIDPNTEKKGSTVLTPDAYKNLNEYIIRYSSNPMVQAIARNMYLEMVINEYTQLQYAAFLETIVRTTEGAVYWHCSQGKDRTGLGSAYLLAALGASREVILQDYQLSNVYYEEEVGQVVNAIKSRGGNIDAMLVAVTFLGANVDYFSKALDLIEEKYGSMYHYLTGPLCMTDEDIEILRNRYLE